MLQRLHNIEAKAHCDIDQSTPVLITPLPRIERYTVEIYTRTMFLKVRQEIQDQAKYFVVQRLDVPEQGYTKFFCVKRFIQHILSMSYTFMRRPDLNLHVYFLKVWGYPAAIS